MNAFYIVPSRNLHCLRYFPDISIIMASMTIGECAYCSKMIHEKNWRKDVYKAQSSVAYPALPRRGALEIP